MRRHKTRTDGERSSGKHPYSYLAQVAPGVQSIVILKPALANIVAVIHIWNHDVADAGVGLSLRLSHGLTEAAHDEHDQTHALLAVVGAVRKGYAGACEDQDAPDPPRRRLIA